MSVSLFGNQVKETNLQPAVPVPKKHWKQLDKRGDYRAEMREFQANPAKFEPAIQEAFAYLISEGNHGPKRSSIGGIGGMKSEKPCESALTGDRTKCLKGCRHVHSVVMQQAMLRARKVEGFAPFVPLGQGISPEEKKLRRQSQKQLPQSTQQVSLLQQPVYCPMILQPVGILSHMYVPTLDPTGMQAFTVVPCIQPILMQPSIAPNPLFYPPLMVLNAPSVPFPVQVQNMPSNEAQIEGRVSPKNLPEIDSEDLTDGFYSFDANQNSGRNESRLASYLTDSEVVTGFRMALPPQDHLGKSRLSEYLKNPSS